MHKSSVCSCFKNVHKRFVLAIRRFFKNGFRGLGFKLSIVFLFFSIAISFMILLPNCFRRVPVYSYFIKELNLPITYELQGKIEIQDAYSNRINTDIKVFVGGYSTVVGLDGEFSLTFSAPDITQFYAVVRFKDTAGQEIIKVEPLIIPTGEHYIQEEFKYYV